MTKEQCHTLSTALGIEMLNNIWWIWFWGIFIWMMNDELIISKRWTTSWSSSLVIQFPLGLRGVAPQYIQIAGESNKAQRWGTSFWKLLGGPEELRAQSRQPWIRWLLFPGNDLLPATGRWSGGCPGGAGCGRHPPWILPDPWGSWRRKRRNTYLLRFSGPRYIPITLRSGSRPGVSASRRAWKPGGGERGLGWPALGLSEVPGRSAALSGEVARGWSPCSEGPEWPKCERASFLDEIENLCSRIFKQNMG